MRQALADLAGLHVKTWTGPLDDVVDALIDVARIDLCLARLVEGHCDALRIIEQAGQQPLDGVYGVWASRSVGTGLTAVREGHGWALSGELRFASGVDLIDRALVPVTLEGGDSQLLDVPVGFGAADHSVWQTAGMDAARTFTINADGEAVAGEPVGRPGFYLDRPGFVVGGLCVAAVWAGGAQQILDVVVEGLRRFPSTPHQLRRVGAIEEAAWTARAAVRGTARRIPELPSDDVAREVDLARTAVVHACEAALAEAPVVVGPGGLSRNVRLVRGLNDLAVYIRQHHVDGVMTALGEQALTRHEPLPT
jgi:alkylation response protein AidB-like acyl-CoA dehydrogenase